MTPVVLTSGETQYAFLNLDGSIDIVLYTGTPVVQPANTTAVIFPVGSGLSNQTQLRDLVIIDGVTNAVGVVVGTGPLAHLMNSKYLVEANAPAGDYTLMPLSIDDMQVEDVVQITNYYDASLTAVVPGINQLVKLNAVDPYSQTTSYTILPIQANFPVRSIRAAYVEGPGGNCSCKSYCLDTPLNLFIREDSDLAGQLIASGAIDVSRINSGLVDLLAMSSEERRHESNGLRWNPRTQNIERGNADDYLDMTSRDVARFINKLRSIHKNIITSIDSVGGIANFVQ